MANIKISDLPAATTPTTGPELIPIVQGGITSQVTIANILPNSAASAGGYGSATQVGTFSTDAQGRFTAAASVTIAIPATQITNGVTGTGAVVLANSPTLVTPDLGIPSVLGAANITGTAAGLTAGNVTINTPNAQTTTSYTAVGADATRIVTVSNAAANAFLIPTNAVVPFELGTVLNIIQIGVGITTISAVTPGTTIVLSAGASPAAPVLAQYESATCTKTGTDAWYVVVGGGSGGGGGGGVTLASDVATATQLYPLFAAATTGSASTIYTSNPNYKFKPSTSELFVKGALKGLYGAAGDTWSVVIGDGANVANLYGSANVVIGNDALFVTDQASQNVAIGKNAMHDTTTGGNTVCIGYGAMYNNTSGSGNTAVGIGSLTSNLTGNNNTALGNGALTQSNSDFNTGVGINALAALTTGSGNTGITPFSAAGSYAPIFDPTTESNRMCLGSTAVTNAYVQVAWTIVSDARDKTSFAPVPHGLDFVTKLKPTAYKFRKNRETDEPVGIVRYGFKAQDVLALEGDSPVLVDTEKLDKLKFNSDSLIPILVNALQELNKKFEDYVAAHPPT